MFYPYITGTGFGSGLFAAQNLMPPHISIPSPLATTGPGSQTKRDLVSLLIVLDWNATTARFTVKPLGYTQTPHEMIPKKYYLFLVTTIPQSLHARRASTLSNTSP